MEIDALYEFKLTEKQKLFALYYTTDSDTYHNATKSHEKAYTKRNGKRPSNATSRGAGAKLLKNPEIKRCIKYIMQKEQPEKDDENGYNALHVLEVCSFYNAADIIDDKGFLKGTLESLGENALAIENIEPVNTPEGQRGKVKLAKRDKYLELLLKYLELIRPEESKTVDSPIVLVNQIQEESDFDRLVRETLTGGAR